MVWLAAIIAFLILAGRGILPGVQPLLTVGSVGIEWPDIIAILIAGVAIYALATGQMSPREVLVILAGILAGKAIGAKKKADKENSRNG
ncbi:MAG: hypothetical protein HY660_10275 [Armatimonadetes bacterium]|nr:hypothetical protein [Armatimonadota bacterium]